MNNEVKEINDVAIKIDGMDLSVPNNLLLIRATELLGIQVPRFCDHPLLKPAGACRQCLVEIEGQKKLVTSCTTEVQSGMIVHTQLSSNRVLKAQESILEFLLINHPLDCPICDKGGECPLQNQTLINGPGESRFVETKRKFLKPIKLSENILLDRERCISCARCTRFADEIAGDPDIQLFNRGPSQEVAINHNIPFNSYFSGNTIQICPVGALTNSFYRFRSRPFDLYSVDSVCEHCASGCKIRVDIRNNRVVRRLARTDDNVNEDWACDKGLFGFHYQNSYRKITTPLIRKNGTLVKTSWKNAISYISESFNAYVGDQSAVILGGKHTLEDAYYYSKFARLCLKTNNIDFRIRANSEEELHFINDYVSCIGSLHDTGITYKDIDNAPFVLLLHFDPEEESPIVFLRLRKNVTNNNLNISTISPYYNNGFKKLNAEWIKMLYNQSLAEIIENNNIINRLKLPGAIILLGEHMLHINNAFYDTLKIAKNTGASVAWIPRRSGEYNAILAGCLPSLLPGGNNISIESNIYNKWDIKNIHKGNDINNIFKKIHNNEINSLLIGGVDIEDYPLSKYAYDALNNVKHIVSLEIFHSKITDIANVVLPVATVADKSGTFVNWEGRLSSFKQAIKSNSNSLISKELLSDGNVLCRIALGMGINIFENNVIDSIKSIINNNYHKSLNNLKFNNKLTQKNNNDNKLMLVTLRYLIDRGLSLINNQYLKHQSKEFVATISTKTALKYNIQNEDLINISNQFGSLDIKCIVSNNIIDNAVLVPQNSYNENVLYNKLQTEAGQFINLKKIIND